MKLWSHLNLIDLKATDFPFILIEWWAEWIQKARPSSCQSLPVPGLVPLVFVFKDLPERSIPGYGGWLVNYPWDAMGVIEVVGAWLQSCSIAISSSETARGRGEHAATKHRGNIVTQCMLRIELTNHWQKSQWQLRRKQAIRRQHRDSVHVTNLTDKSLTNENHNGNCAGNKQCRLRTGTKEFCKLGIYHLPVHVKGASHQKDLFLEGRRQTKLYNTIQSSPFLKLTSSDLSTLALLLVSHICSSCRWAVYGGPRINARGRIWKGAWADMQALRGDQSIGRCSFLLI